MRKLQTQVEALTKNVQEQIDAQATAESRAQEAESATNEAVRAAQGTL